MTTAEGLTALIERTVNRAIATGERVERNRIRSALASMTGLTTDELDFRERVLALIDNDTTVDMVREPGLEGPSPRPDDDQSGLADSAAATVREPVVGSALCRVGKTTGSPKAAALNTGVPAPG